MTPSACSAATPWAENGVPIFTELNKKERQIILTKSHADWDSVYEGRGPGGIGLAGAGRSSSMLQSRRAQPSWVCYGLS